MTLRVAFVLLIASVSQQAFAQEAEPQIVELGDPRLGPELVGAELLVLRASNGTYYQGKVREATATRIVIVGEGVFEVPASDIRNAWTIRPAKVPAAIGDRATAVTRTGVTTEGTVTAIDEIGVTLGTIRHSWHELMRIEVVPALQLPPGPVDVDAMGIVPRALEQPDPEYPALAREAKLTGRAVIAIVVDETGNVSSATVVDGRAPFDAPALKAVKRWRYEPVLVNGKAVPWKTRVNVDFRMRERVIATSPKELFGERGTIEIGAAFSLSGETTRANVGSVDRSSRGSAIRVNPFIGYFAIDGLEISAEGEFTRSFTDYTSGWEDSSRLGVSVTAAYLFRLGFVHVGPEVELGVYNTIAKESGGGTRTVLLETGRTSTLNAVAKVPLGGNALLTVGAGMTFDLFYADFDVGANADAGEGSRTGFQTFIGMSFWSPTRWSRSRQNAND